ncbi:flagellar export protein FliJ [Limimonas halophila]|uniref:Flagellar FliJ protein n=1 Tax=Limimonas halophila TaxID=1082479 RepID=A0A1G7M3H1_9PROT|nr:flagellar export protein FliJ [Limimonas halophila]SDF56378.1 flagellar export protein FliJ [Limimonas halophila]
MTALSELVRISRWHLDEKRQKLGDLERLADRLRDDLRKLDDTIAHEQRVVQEDPSARETYSAYIKAEMERRGRLEQSIANVQSEIESAREEVAEAFRELKKYEMAKANQDQRETERLKKAEEKQMDEIGLQLHQRNNSG